MDLLLLLGDNIRNTRKSKGLSQEELALEAGMKRSYVSEVERGLRNPTVRALSRIAAVLEVEPWELLRKGHSGDGEASPQPTAQSM